MKQSKKKKRKRTAQEKRPKKTREEKTQKKTRREDKEIIWSEVTRKKKEKENKVREF